MTISAYLKKLSAETPAPGGGSAAALVGAVGASLLSMVARYTARGAGRRALAVRSRNIARFAESSQRRLRRLMAEDEKAYLRLVKKRQKLSVKNAEKLYKKAAEVPMKVCGTISAGLEKCEELSDHCRIFLLSDLAEAAILMEAAFLSAKANVDINLLSIKDAGYKKKTRKRLLKYKNSVLKAKRKVLKRWQRRY